MKVFCFGDTVNPDKTIVSLLLLPRVIIVEKRQPTVRRRDFNVSWNVIMHPLFQH